jgi:hypothetical protein
MNSPFTWIRNVIVDGGKRCHALIHLLAAAAALTSFDFSQNPCADRHVSAVRPVQRIQIGMIADSCLPRADACWPDDDPAALTLIGGEVAYSRGSTAKSGNLYERRCAAASP